MFQFVIVTDWFIPHNPAFYIKIVNFYTIRQKFTLPNSFSILYFLHKRIAAILQLWTINHVGAINAATTTHIFCIISSVDFTRSIHVKEIVWQRQKLCIMPCSENPLLYKIIPQMLWFDICFSIVFPFFLMNFYLWHFLMNQEIKLCISASVKTVLSMMIVSCVSPFSIFLLSPKTQ